MDNENEQNSNTGSGSGGSNGGGGNPRPQVSQMSLYERQAVQALQALQRQPNAAAQYLQQMYAAQHQHLMLQQHLSSAQLQSLAAVQQVTLAANRQVTSQSTSDSQTTGTSQSTINLATSSGSPLTSRPQTVSSPVTSVLLGTTSSSLTPTQAKMYLQAQLPQPGSLLQVARTLTRNVPLTPQLILMPGGGVATVQPEVTTTGSALQGDSDQAQNLALRNQQGLAAGSQLQNSGPKGASVVVSQSSSLSPPQTITVSQASTLNLSQAAACLSQTPAVSQSAATGKGPGCAQTAGVANQSDADTPPKRAELDLASTTHSCGINLTRSVTPAGQTLISSAATYTQIQPQPLSHQPKQLVIHQHQQHIAIHQQHIQHRPSQLAHLHLAQPHPAPHSQTLVVQPLSQAQPQAQAQAEVCSQLHKLAQPQPPAQPPKQAIQPIKVQTSSAHLQVTAKFVAQPYAALGGSGSGQAQATGPGSSPAASTATLQTSTSTQTPVIDLVPAPITGTAHAQSLSQVQAAQIQAHVQPQAHVHVHPQIQTQTQAQTQTQVQTHFKPQTQIQAKSQAHIQPQSQAHIQPQSQAHIQPQSQAHIQPQSQTHIQPQSQALIQPQSQAHIQPQSQAQTQTQTQAQTQPQASAVSPTPSGFHLQPLPLPLKTAVVGVKRKAEDDEEKVFPDKLSTSPLEPPQLTPNPLTTALEQKLPTGGKGELLHSGPPVLTSISSLSAPTLLKVSTRHGGDIKPPQAIVKPHILTHVIEGFVIQEGAEPFPVDSVLSSVDSKQKQQEPPVLHPETQPPKSEPVPPEGSDVAREMLKCEFCGQLEQAEKFKRSKRFCSMACAKRYNVSCRKGVRRFTTDKLSPLHTLHKDSGVRIGRRTSKKESGDSIRGSIHKRHLKNQEESSRASDNSSYDEALSPLSPGLGQLRQSQCDRESNSCGSGMPDLMGINPSFLCSNPALWTVEQVHEFISSLPGCQDVSEEFRSQEIDGQALLLLKEEHLMTAMNMKLGPALKICARINLLKEP